MTTAKQKRLGKWYWKAVNVTQGRERGSKTSLINACSRERGLSKDDCTDKVTAGLKGRRKPKKSGTPWKRRKSQSKAAKASRSGFKAALTKCKTKRGGKKKTRKQFLACMHTNAPKEIEKRM